MLGKLLATHPALTSLNIERITLGESGARSLADAILRALPLDGMPVYGGRDSGDGASALLTALRSALLDVLLYLF